MTIRLAAVQLDFTPVAVSGQDNLWLPDEPLLFDDPLTPPSVSVTELRQLTMYDRLQLGIRSTNDRELTLRLKQILDYCISRQVDLVVFPEYAVPPQLIGTLAGYAGHLSIFAGIGLIRKSDIAYLQPYGGSSELTNRDCGVYLSADGGAINAVFITKQHIAEGERADPGGGSLTVNLTTDRPHAVRLCVCLDFPADAALLDPDQPPVDIVAISALTRTATDFTAAVPRDFVRIFANHAYFGGTTILIPSLVGFARVGRHGVDPLPARHEGVVIVDFDRYAQKPTARRTPRNRLIARAAIVYEEDSETDQSGVAQVVPELSSMTTDEYLAGTYHEFLDRALRIVRGRPGFQVVQESIESLARNEGIGIVSTSELESLTRHLVLTDVLTHTELRYRQIDSVLEAVKPFIVDDTPGIGNLRDVFLARKQQLIERVRPTRRSPRDRQVGASEVPVGDVQTDAHRFFAARLGHFDPVDAVRTLPLQLTVLSNIVESCEHELEIAYRVSTTQTMGEELVPFFDVVAIARGVSAQELAQLQEGLGQQIGQALSGGWAISGTSTAIDPIGAWQVELRPVDSDWAPAVREDWGAVIDLVRTQQAGIEVEVRIVKHRGAGPTLPPVSRGGSEAERALAPSDREIRGFVDDVDRMAAEFFERIAGDAGHERPGLQLRFVIASSAALPGSLVRAIGLQLIGTPRFEVVSKPDSAPEGYAARLLKPSEALRLFHPPHGRLQSRGLSRRRPTSLALPVIALPATGVVLGTARSSSARVDRHVDVRLDDIARLRHVYMIGKTGSGKTNLLKNMARQDLEAGAGVAVIDPHGDLVEYLLRHATGREHEVTLLDFGDPDFTPVLNPLDLDVNVQSRADQRFAIDEFIRILVRQSYHEFYGPRFEDTVRMTLESLLRAGLTDVPSVLGVPRILRNERYRRALREAVQDDADLRDRWDNFEAQLGTEKAELLHWVLAKFSDMDAEGSLAPVLAGGTSSVSIRDVVNRGGVLLVRVPEWQIGIAAAGFIGHLVQERVRRAAFDRLRRAGGDGRTIAPFYVYVDEFQRFATTGFETLVAEARKFGLGLTLAHQNLLQLEEFSRFTGSSSRQLIDAILGNVGSVVVLGVSPSDAVPLAQTLGVPTESIDNITRHTGLAKVLFGGEESPPFTIDIPNAESDRGLPSARDHVIERMKASGAWLPREHVLRRLDEEAKSLAGKTAASEPQTSFLQEWLDAKRLSSDRPRRPRRTQPRATK